MITNSFESTNSLSEAEKPLRRLPEVQFMVHSVEIYMEMKLLESKFDWSISKSESLTLASPEEEEIEHAENPRIEVRHRDRLINDTLIKVRFTMF